MLLNLLKYVRMAVFLVMIMVSICALSGVLLVFYIAGDLPKLPTPLSRIIETPQSQIFSSGGQVIMTLGERKAVSLDMVSKDFINAIVATEDHRFFDHHGVNKLRTLKGLYVTFFEPGKVQGASTITQQLAKNMFFSFEQTFQRKFKELLVALQIEAACSKEEILHAYINQIHFGAGAQGIEKAAQVFFDKSALDLNLSEAALLAGLPKSPTYYNPFRYYERAFTRMKVVLVRMVHAGFITEIQAREAMAERPELFRNRIDSRTGSYFLDALLQELVSRYGEDVVYHGGIRIFTTLDSRMQANAKAAVSQGMKRLDDIMGITEEDIERPQGALVALDTGSGAIKALIGGRDYYESEFNRAVKARRQPGSGFKPFLYYAAFKELGYHPATVMTDRPVIVPVKGARDWEPRNFGKNYAGNMILKKALTDSVNTIAAQLVEELGPSKVTQVAKSCGITSPLKEVYSVALGTSSVTPLEMAGAFSVFANLGAWHKPFMIWRVEDAMGRVIFEHIIQEKRVLDETTTYQVVDMMKSVIDTGSGKVIRKMGFDRAAAGKTGTTDNYKDAWFTGFTPSLCTSVWVGYDKSRRLIAKKRVGITGGRGAAPIWADFMMETLKSDPDRDFPIPDHIRFETVDTQTGCPKSVSQPGIELMSVALKSDQLPCEENQVP